MCCKLSRKTIRNQNLNLLSFCLSSSFFFSKHNLCRSHAGHLTSKGSITWLPQRLALIFGASFHHKGLAHFPLRDSSRRNRPLQSCGTHPQPNWRLQEQHNAVKQQVARYQIHKSRSRDTREPKTRGPSSK
jgi:hypothetical protein